ncbi:T9SS type A sorting domain-containing protein [Pontibacter korlensis]|uniref:Secretion system C-terminal sorting domain-containing protein n=1 Tax=Pontibacter korlensis TaxID=400092 RepID=A0A0E3ZJ59_9BACT|nr:T9SS type A sorting domain-containing protein [Pontibacter korlensis]AKD05774.1 hypothetical protein PKOR_16460 [Pontibacter korlensis]
MVKRFTLLFCAFLFSLHAFSQEPPGPDIVTELVPLPVAKNTGEKPQSKVWTHACKTWTVLADAEGTHLWRLDDTKWTRVLTLSSITYNADCKVVGNVAHVLLYRGKDLIYLTSLEHVPAQNTYRFWSKRPEPSSLRLDRGAETATIDIDSKGRMWLASDATSSVEVRWSDSPYTTWSDPITLATEVTEDDIAAVVAMPGKVGVMWSNLNKQRFGFRTHTDGADPTAWSEDEVPASQSALNVGLGMADDHLNLAIADDGTLYCAVKTEYNKEGYPRIALLVRRPSGTWDDLYEVSQSGTRPIVILNEEIGKLKVIYTNSQEHGGNIVYKESAAPSIAFGPVRTLIDGSYNNVTSSKANYKSDAVVLASNETHAVGVQISDGIPPEVCPVYMDWTAYPNPFSSKTAVYFSLLEGGQYTMVLYDSKGAQLDLKQGDAVAGEINKIEFDGENLPRGLYFVRVKSQERSQTMKLVLSK